MMKNGVTTGLRLVYQVLLRRFGLVPDAKGTAASNPGAGRIAFVAEHNGTTQIFTIDPEGNDIVPPANAPVSLVRPSGLPEDLMFPTLSPHGRMIAYLTYVRPGHAPALVVMTADGSNPCRINIGKAIAVSPPVWSPESERLAYISIRSDASQSGLYIVDVATNTERKVDTRTPIHFNFADNPSVNLPALTDADRPAWAPNFSSFMVLGGLGTDEKTVLQITLDGTVTRLSPGNPTVILSSAAFSPDGLKVLHRAHTNAFQFWLIGDLVAQKTVELRLFSGHEVPFVPPSRSLAGHPMGNRSFSLR
jgi:Tol biopolymer transport system component